MILVHQTKAQFAARWRAKFRAASREEACRMAAWLLDRIDAGDFTDAQVRTAFGLTTTQYNNLKTRLTSMRTAWQALQQAAGE